MVQTCFNANPTHPFVSQDRHYHVYANRNIDTLQSIKVSMFSVICFKNDTLFPRFSNNPVSARKIFIPFAFCGALEVFGAWLEDDTLPP